MNFSTTKNSIAVWLDYTSCLAWICIPSIFLLCFSISLFVLFLSFQNIFLSTLLCSFVLSYTFSSSLLPFFLCCFSFFRRFALILFTTFRVKNAFSLLFDAEVQLNETRKRQKFQQIWFLKRSSEERWLQNKKCLFVDIYKENRYDSSKKSILSNFVPLESF